MIFASRAAYIARVGGTLLEVVAHVGVNGVVRLVLRVDLFPDVNLAGVGPALGVVLRHHPEGGEVTRVGSGLQATFHAAIGEVHLAGTFDGTAYHGHVAFTVHVVGNASSDEFAVFDECGFGLTFGGLCGEAFPSGILAGAAAPEFGVGKGTILAVELVAELELVFFRAVGLKVYVNAHIAVDTVLCDGHGIAGFGLGVDIFAPLAVAVNVLFAIEVVTMAHNGSVNHVALGRCRGENDVRCAERDCFGNAGVVAAHYVAAHTVHFEVYVVVVDVHEEVNDVTAVGIDAVRSAFCPVAGGVDVVHVELETSAVDAGRKVGGNLEGGKGIASSFGRLAFASTVESVVVRVREEFAVLTRSSVGVEVSGERTVLVHVEVEVGVDEFVAFVDNGIADDIACLGLHLFRQQVAVDRCIAGIGHFERGGLAVARGEFDRGEHVVGGVGHLEFAVEVEVVFAAYDYFTIAEVGHETDVAVDERSGDGVFAVLEHAGIDGGLVPLAVFVDEAVALEVVTVTDYEV